VLPRGAWRRRVAADAELEELSTVEAVAAIGLPESTDVVSAVRDRAHIHWRYFSHGSRHRSVFAYRRADATGPSMIVVEPVVRGHRGQIRGLTVSDLWGPLAPEDLPILAGLLDTRYSQSYDMLVIRGVNVFPHAIDEIVRGFPEVVEHRLTASTRESLDELALDIEDRLDDPGRVVRELKIRLGLRVDVRTVPIGSLPRFEGKGRRFVDRRRQPGGDA
jgi:hypothetical protein